MKKDILLLGSYLLLCVAMLVVFGTSTTGCVWAGSSANLENGVSHKSRGISFASKTGLKDLNAATTLSNTNYTRNLTAQGFTTQGQFTEAAQGAGQILGQAVRAYQGLPPAAPAAPAAVPFSTPPAPAPPDPGLVPVDAETEIEDAPTPTDESFPADDGPPVVSPDPDPGSGA